jgi:hypothetical protein
LEPGRNFVVGGLTRVSSALFAALIMARPIVSRRAGAIGGQSLRAALKSDDLSTNFLPQPLGRRNASRSPRFAKSLVRLNIRCVTQCAFKEPDITLVQRSNRSSICFNCAFCSRSLLAS